MTKVLLKSYAGFSTFAHFVSRCCGCSSRCPGSSAYVRLLSSNTSNESFPSLLKDSHVQNPFSDPQRRRKTPLDAKVSQLDELSSEDISEKRKPPIAIDHKIVPNKISEGSAFIKSPNAASIPNLDRLLSKLGIQAIATDATEDDKREHRIRRTTKLGVIFAAGSFVIGIAWFCIHYGRSPRSSEGVAVADEFTGSIFAPFQRIRKNFHQWIDYVVEPSREVLLPPPIASPYYQPKYTLVMELKHFLVAPDWSYSSGYRFQKRPALDYFLTLVKYPNFEVVLYTSESALSAHQLVESLDPDHCVMYKLYRDCTKYMNGHHVKVLSQLNRDLSKVIYIDHDPKSCELNPENLLLVPKWDGNMNDTALVDLAELLKTIHLSDIDDVRPTLQYFSQFDDPAKEFRRRAVELANKDAECVERKADSNPVRRYAGKLFGFGRHVV